MSFQLYPAVMRWRMLFGSPAALVCAALTPPWRDGDADNQTFQAPLPPD